MCGDLRLAASARQKIVCADPEHGAKLAMRTLPKRKGAAALESAEGQGGSYGPLLATDLLGLALYKADSGDARC